MAAGRLTRETSQLSFRILGPLQFEAGGNHVDAGPRKQRIVLAALLCHANSRVSVDALAEALWLGAPPRTARKNIQVYMSTLRGMNHAQLAPRISHRTGGYLLHIEPTELDSLRFEQLVRDTARIRRVESAPVVAEVLGDALALWRGRALDGMCDVPLLAAAAERLERQFLTAFEDWAEAELETGRGQSMVERVCELAQQHPLRERLRILQMTSLWQADRRTEALAVYDELRRTLAHELGLSPSPAVEAFYRSALRGELPTIRSTARTMSSLPEDPPHHTARPDISGQLTEVLTRGRHRLVVVTGPLGSGKSTLAVHAAHQLADRFPDGRFFVRMHDVEGRLRPVEQIIAEVLARDLASSAGRDPDERRRDQRRAWQQWLAAKRALIVLDDVRREPDVLPLLPETGISTVVLTSRSRLAGLESARRFAVPPFRVPTALELLEKAIGAQRVAADPCSAERIVGATGLVPLGLRLIAERLALLHYVPLREYAARIGDPLSLLDELSAGDPTIRRRLADAVDELPPPAARAVVRLGSLPEPAFTLAEAAAVLQVPEQEAMRILERLLEAALVTVPSAEVLAHEVKYEMAPLAFAHAREAASALGGAADVR